MEPKSLALTYTLTPEDSLAVWRFQTRRAFLVICFVFVIFIGVGAYKSITDHASAAANFVPLFAFAAFLPIWRFWWIPGKIRRRYWENRLLHDEVRRILSEEGTSVTSAHAEYNLPWDTFAKWRETPGAFLIYPSPTLYNTLPKRAFENEDDIRWFREVLTARVSKK